MFYLYAFIAGIFIILLGGNVYFIQENAKLKLQAEINNSLVDSQNRAIEELAIANDEYHCSIDDMNRYTNEKYKKALRGHETETCEQKLEAITKSFQTFGNIK